MFSAAGPLCFNLHKPYKYQNKSQEKGVCFIAVVKQQFKWACSGHHYNTFAI